MEVTTGKFGQQYVARHRVTTVLVVIAETFTYVSVDWGLGEFRVIRDVPYNSVPFFTHPDIDLFVYIKNVKLI